MQSTRKIVRSLEKHADKLLQEKYVQLNTKCLVCGDQTSEMHHYIPKSQSNNLRYDPLNLVPLCKRCHCRHHLSGDPSIVAEIIRKNGLTWDEDLQRRRHIICKLNKEKLQEIVKTLYS